MNGGVALSSPLNAGGNVRVTVNWHAPKGWRLMDMNLRSNQPIPVREQQVTVALLSSADAVLSTATTTTDANGVAQITATGGAAKVWVTDRFGNQATVALP